MTLETRFTALVLAGDRAKNDPFAGTFPGRKALLDINGRPMIGYVLDAVEGAVAVGDVYVVANGVKDIEQGLIRCGRNVKRTRFVEGGTSPVNSVLKTIETLRPAFPVLVLTADNPLLSATALDDFCDQARAEEGADIAFAVAEMSRLQDQYPGARRTFVKLKGEGYSGCNLYALLNSGALNAARFWLKVESDRKKTLAMIAGFGFGTLIRVLTRTITLEEALVRASKVLGAVVRPVLVGEIRIAIDVDRVEQAELVRNLLKKEP